MVYTGLSQAKSEQVTLSVTDVFNSLSNKAQETTQAILLDWI